MKPEDVPDELIGVAHMAFRFSDEQDTESALGEALAAVLPVHEKQVREQVAQEIEAAAPPDPRGSAMPNFVGGAMRQAADIARGEVR